MSKTNIKNNILEFSNGNNEPSWVKKCRIDSYKKIDSFNHPSFGPEIKLDVDLLSYFEKQSTNFCLETDLFIACDIHTAFIKFPNLVEKYYGKLIMTDENRYTILNSVVFESGYFIYVPKDKKVNFPIFNRNVNCSFLRSLIIVDENAELNFIDYCNSNSDFCYDGTEIYVEQGARCRYLNLSMNSNTSTVVSMKRAQVEESASMEWVNVVTGTKIFMGYPSSILKGKKSSSISSTLTIAENDSSINIGSKMIHENDHTTSTIKNFSYIGNNGELEIRNVVNIKKNAFHSSSNVKYEYCGKGNNSKYDNVPRYIVDNDSSSILFTTSSNSKLNTDIMDFVENNFMKLSKINKKYLQELIKKGN